MANNNKQVCSFCGRARREAGPLVQGSGLSICQQCTKQCVATFESSKPQFNHPIKQLSDLHTPKQLHQLLNEFVIGQEAAKKTLSVAVYNHYKRLNNQHDDSNIEIDKSNILMIGPTGSGKTLLAKTLARILDVPFAIADATTLTEAGYVGDDVENIIRILVSKCDGNKEKAERGIIFIDEIDKISRRSDSASITRDVSGEGVQQAMLKLIEGTIASVSLQGGRRHPQQETLSIDTKNILFICGGAFDGLERIIQKRIEKTSSIGFSANIKSSSKEKTITDLFAMIEPDDLVKFGLIPEIVGRLTINVALEELDEKALIEILTKPKNAVVKQFIEFFNMENIHLEFKPSALNAIAKLAIKRKTGARGLRSILEQVLLETMYEVPSQNNIDKIIIDKSVINQENEPLIIKKIQSIAS